MPGINLLPLPKMRGNNTVGFGERVATASPFDGRLKMPHVLTMKRTLSPITRARIFDWPDEQIARRAHELWQRRGGGHGCDWADWFQAEREINELHQQRLQESLFSYQRATSDAVTLARLQTGETIE